MSWIFLATVAQLINAVVAVSDKYLVTDEKALPKPFVYAFYTCVITAFWLLVYPIGLIPGLSELGVPKLSNVQAPSIEVISMALLAAYTFFLAVVSLYDALKKADTSDVMPVVGAVSAISTFGLSFLLLGATFSPHFIWGIILLAAGTFMVSQIRFTRHLAIVTIHSGIFFALHYIAMKGLFEETSFDDGFFWSRIALVFFVLSLLLVPNYYRLIKDQNQKTSRRTGLLVLGNKLLAGVAAFMLLKATDWGDVAVVQALDGVKFVFILLIGIFVARFLPESAGERHHNATTIVQKFIYVTIICIGYVMLFS